MNKPRKKIASGGRKAASGGWRLHDDRPPTFRGWISTDEGEIGRREWRGRTEIVDVHPLDGSPHPFGDYRVTSSNGSSYTVEIRSLTTHINSCECGDHRTNRLGTCKHIEGVLHHLRGNRAASPRRRKPKEPESSGRIEIFLDERADRAVRMTVPAAIERAHPAFVREAERHCRSLRRQSRKALDALRHMARAHPRRLRVSRSLEHWLDARKAPARRRRERARFVADLEAGRRSFGFLKHPLLPYQVEGALHLAFGERVLLADDMGLGKTVQAIAACALLRSLRGVERVLVVSPASLKSEWEEQIAKFSDLPSTIVFGGNPARRAAYRRHTFFTLCNYEQVVADGKDLLDALAPDIVILDEAQRIKNWQTKTANAVKKLRSRYAFVLTGTPLENRIDEIYSIVQFLDPELLGPLFRFNREFYALDEKGKPSGFRNLDELARRVSSVMLRRRKEDVEGELPGRTVKTFFVPMTEAQTSAYEDYDHYVKRLAALAAKRPLTRDEFDRLQKFLACMRMVCDTPYILGDENRDCPKMEEMERLLPGLLEDPRRKIIVFSEWVRMLELVREYAVATGIEFAWHTGSVPQPQRRAEIRRFREDPECRLFLSSESGGVGLNLQAADTVVNMDQPWNPARLEQRIARAWRKHQTRPVTVINLVSEDTIEHRMLGLLDAKRTLAEGVLDQRGDLSEIRLPTGRAAFMERLDAMLGARNGRRGGNGSGRRCGGRCDRSGAHPGRAASRRPGDGARRDAATGLRARRRRGGAGGARPGARAHRRGGTPTRRIRGAQRQGDRSGDPRNDAPTRRSGTDRVAGGRAEGGLARLRCGTLRVRRPSPAGEGAHRPCRAQAQGGGAARGRGLRRGSPHARGGGGPARGRGAGGDARTVRARRRRVGRGAPARRGAGRGPGRSAARRDTGPVGRRATGRRGGTDRRVRVRHLPDGRGGFRSIARRGGVAAFAERGFVGPGIPPVSRLLPNSLIAISRAAPPAFSPACGAGGGLHICTTSTQIPYHTQVRGLPGESLDLPPRWTFLPTSS